MRSETISKSPFISSTAAELVFFAASAGAGIVSADLFALDDRARNRSVAGGLRFGNNDRQRFYQTTKGGDGKWYADFSRWADFEGNSKTFLNKSSSWNYSGDMSYDALMSEYNSGEYEKLTRYEGVNLVNEKVDWTPNFINVDLSGMRSSGSVPQYMVNYGGGWINIYDTKAHYQKYGCITEDEGSKMLFGIGNRISFTEKSKSQLENLIK